MISLFALCSLILPLFFITAFLTFAAVLALDKSSTECLTDLKMMKMGGKYTLLNKNLPAHLDSHSAICFRGVLHMLCGCVSYPATVIFVQLPVSGNKTFKWGFSFLLTHKHTKLHFIDIKVKYLPFVWLFRERNSIVSLKKKQEKKAVNLISYHHQRHLLSSCGSSHMWAVNIPILLCMCTSLATSLSGGRLTSLSYISNDQPSSLKVTAKLSYFLLAFLEQKENLLYQHFH